MARVQNYRKSPTSKSKLRLWLGKQFAEDLIYQWVSIPPSCYLKLCAPPTLNTNSRIPSSICGYFFFLKNNHHKKRLQQVSTVVIVDEVECPLTQSRYLMPTSKTPVVDWVVVGRTWEREAMNIPWACCPNPTGGAMTSGRAGREVP